MDQTTICRDHLVHCVFTGPQRRGASDTHHETVHYPHFPKPGVSTNTHTGQEDLPITWNDAGTFVHPLAHEHSRDALKYWTSVAYWNSKDPEFITGGLVQVKDEYHKMLCSDRVGMQRRWERGNAMPGRAPAFGEHAETAQRDNVCARTAWKKSTARCYSYVRLKQSMRILGVDPREQLLLLNWLRRQSRLEWSQMMYHPWELLHLELIMKRSKEGAEERGRRQETQPQG